MFKQLHYTYISWLVISPENSLKKISLFSLSSNIYSICLQGNRDVVCIEEIIWAKVCRNEVLLCLHLISRISSGNLVESEPSGIHQFILAAIVCTFISNLYAADRLHTCSKENIVQNNKLYWRSFSTLKLLT